MHIGRFVYWKTQLISDMSSSKNSKSAANSSSSRKLTFFVPGDGIDREVISTDICRYLGNDATIRPGEYTVGSRFNRVNLKSRARELICTRIRPLVIRTGATLSQHIEH